MTYFNNQYIKLDIPLEEIAKIEIKTTDILNCMISDLDIKDFDPNIIIAFGIDKKIDYCNIYSSVRILITDEETLKGKIEEIPDFIEVIIINNKIYYNRNNVNSDKDLDLLDFENQNEISETIAERLIERGKINSCNNEGNTILNYLIWNGKEKKAIELIDKMEIESINKVNKYGYTALIYACSLGLENIALKLLEREGININQVGKYGNKALIFACSSGLKNIALKLLEREEIIINQVNENANAALIHACYNKLESVSLKLLERKEKNINLKNYNRKTILKLLDYAKRNKMESVVNRIKELQMK